jgi:hypothetical protein
MASDQTKLSRLRSTLSFAKVGVAMFAGWTFGGILLLFMYNSPTSTALAVLPLVLLVVTCIVKARVKYLVKKLNKQEQWIRDVQKD